MGRMQHIWLLFACQKLGLTRFLLPLAVKAVRVCTTIFLIVQISSLVCTIQILKWLFHFFTSLQVHFTPLFQLRSGFLFIIFSSQSSSLSSSTSTSSSSSSSSSLLFLLVVVVVVVVVVVAVFVLSTSLSSCSGYSFNFRFLFLFFLSLFSPLFVIYFIYILLIIALEYLGHILALSLSFDISVLLPSVRVIFMSISPSHPFLSFFVAKCLSSPLPPPPSPFLFVHRLLLVVQKASEMEMLSTEVQEVISLSRGQ